MDPEHVEIEYELIIEESSPLNIDEPPTCRTLTSHSLELGMDEVLVKLNEFKKKNSKKKRNGAHKKRGRKPIRPLDPIKIKTEEKDKYWLRSFRKYIKENFYKFSHTLSQEDFSFWTEHISTQGVPEKGNQFSSYGKKYKNYLFSSYDFVYRFQQWFIENAESELSKKYERGSDLWFVFYDYGSTELYNYIPKGCSSLNSGGSSESPRSFSLNDIVYTAPSEDPVDFCMVMADNQIIDSFFK